MTDKTPTTNTSSDAQKSDYKIDKTAFSMGKMGKDDTERHNYRNKTVAERLAIANDLIRVSYGYVNCAEPAMDKTKFEMIKRN